MFDQFVFFSQSFWIFIAQSIFSFFNPAGLDQEAKINLIESGIDTGIIFLRTQGFEATYDEFNANLNKDLIEIKNLVIKKQLDPYDIEFCNVKNIKVKSIWHPQVCEIDIRIDKLTFSGLNLNYKSNFPFKITLENIEFDLSIFNDSDSKTFKKLFEIDEKILADLSLELKYEFSKNIFHNNISLSLHDFGTIDTNLIFKNIIYSDEYFSLNLDKFNFNLKDETIIKKINLLLDIEQGNNLHEIAKNNLKKRSTININDQNKLDKIKKHNDIISSIGYHYPMYDENTNQILLFLKSAKNISCYRENEHLLNLEVLDEIERTGFPLLLAIFCENIITETANES
ncbi:hypothetical protein OAK12_01120 [Alphaproteobacteria bacterium]|nr:hypothetical protein [Alphaproteobacteria bacterium]